MLLRDAHRVLISNSAIGNQEVISEQGIQTSA